MTKNEQYLLDEEIIDLYWERNEQAIDETDKKYRNYLYAIAYNILHDRLDCEECLNDTYLGTWNAIPPTRPTRFQLFLSKITRNVSVDKYREEHASKRVPAELIVSIDELGESIASENLEDGSEVISALADILNGYLRKLDERSQFAFVCRYYYFDSIESISQMLGISERSVYRMLANARKELKAKLNEEGYNV